MGFLIEYVPVLHWIALRLNVCLGGYAVLFAMLVRAAGVCQAPGSQARSHCPNHKWLGRVTSPNEFQVASHWAAHWVCEPLGDRAVLSVQLALLSTSSGFAMWSGSCICVL